MFLVFTLRLLLLGPAIRQIRTGLQMRELQPQIRHCRRYAGDRQRMALEMQKLQQEHGFNPLMVVFRCWCRRRCSSGSSRAAVLQPHRNRSRWARDDCAGQREHRDYIFSPADVQSFLSARLFGAPISTAITSPQSTLESFAAHGGVPTVATIAAVAIPLM